VPQSQKNFKTTVQKNKMTASRKFNQLTLVFTNYSKFTPRYYTCN